MALLPRRLTLGRYTARQALQEVRVVIPDEHYQVVNFRQGDLPGIGVLNSALVEFEAREVFRWHLSVLINFTSLIEYGMPSEDDRKLVDPFGDALDALLKDDRERPNALFLGRITWNATRELLYRVHDPEASNQVLKAVIDGHEHPREFDFRIEDDPEWKLAAWHLQACSGS